MRWDPLNVKTKAVKYFKSAKEKYEILHSEIAWLPEIFVQPMTNWNTETTHSIYLLYCWYELYNNF